MHTLPDALPWWSLQIGGRITKFEIVFLNLDTMKKTLNLWLTKTAAESYIRWISYDS